MPGSAYGGARPYWDSETKRHYPETETNTAPPVQDDIAPQDKIVREHGFNVAPGESAPASNRIFRKGISYYIGIGLITLGGGLFILGMLARRKKV